jgi:hypothetical protein
MSIIGLSRTSSVYLRAVSVVMLLLGTSGAMTNVAAAHPSPNVQVRVVSAGFDSPRGVAISHGHVLVSETGHGGDVCIPSPYGPNCIGLSSQISVVDPNHGTHHPLITGLFSSVLGAVGPIGVEGISIRHGNVLAILGQNSRLFESIDCSVQPPDCPTVKSAALGQSGHLISVSDNGSWRSVASVGAFDFDHFADHIAENPLQKHEANPFGVLAIDNGAFVADAAAGDLDFVSNSGQVKLVHYFHFNPPSGAFPSDEVPTCIVRARGHVFMGDLNGRLFRLDGTTPTQIPVVGSGRTALLHHITGCGTAREDDGVIYLVNMWTTDGSPTPNTGSVVGYNVDTGRASSVANALNFPNMVAVGPDQTLYVSANSVCPGSGGPVAECGFMGQTSGLLLKIALHEDHDQ